MKNGGKNGQNYMIFAFNPLYELLIQREFSVAGYTKIDIFFLFNVVYFILVLERGLG